MTPFEFPQPGERTNAASIPVQQETLLAWAIDVERVYLSLVQHGADFAAIDAADRVSNELYDRLTRREQQEFELLAFKMLVASHLEEQA